jgi:excisionase family DNA binding protein
MDQLLLRPGEVATALGISRAFAYQLLATGQLPSVRLGKAAVRVPRAALLEWLKTQSLSSRSTSSRTAKKAKISK